MKKFACVSGIAALLLLVLLVSGWADANDKLKKAIREGNAYFASAKYEEALLSYESALEASPENGALHFNAAQTAYLLGDYEKTAQYYEKAEDCVDKYLHAGNAFYRMAEGAEDATQKMQQYARAVQIYKEGILLYPQDLPLKYNYERVKEKLDALEEEREQESEGESGDQSDNRNEDESQESQGENQESQDAENQESQDAENQDPENAESAQDEQDQSAEQDGEQDEQDQSAEQDGEQEEAYAQDEGEEGETDPDQAAIERILAMLENQEEEDLKNNREVVGGKEGANGW
ncbi:MAG: hypothetical protein FWH49_07880 [Clostridiales bacterium]|nr:hypothetical protein [Clostridiales bacterium]